MSDVVELFMRILAKRNELLAQCPPPPHVEGATNLPVVVERVGTQGPRVLVVHGGVQGGIGGGPATFAQQRVLGQQGFRLELVERPGFARSPSRGVDDMDADAQWIADMLGDDANLIGHSWGGASALLGAARRPNAVRTLILIEPALQTLVAMDPQADKSVLAALLEPLWAATTPADYARGFIRSLGVPGDVYTEQALAALDDAAATRLGASFLYAKPAPPPALLQAAQAVRAANIPTLLISGGWSPPIEAVAEICARLLGGTHIVVKSPNHYPQMANPQAFNQAIAQFMRR